MTHVALTADGTTIVSASNDQTLRVWDMATDALRHTILTSHTDEVPHVALTADGATAVSASNDQTLRVWDVANGAARGVFNATTEGRLALAHAFPAITDFDGFQRRGGHGLTWRGHLITVGGLIFAADAGLLNAAWTIPS